ncbi:hypothetical protein V6N13_024702 [Hibiscus sabdariffa]|uniref:Uncharacterized protein n=2 Tax=Hibiscus sabdariffa TaxID=183260 RepID=A0ABR2A8R0_9ROSI
MEGEGKESWRWFLQKLMVDLNHPNGEGLTLMSDMQKAYFKGTSKCDVVDNNMAEAFNMWIVEARCKPIITILKEIRTMVMSRMNVKRAWTGTWRTNIVPRALQKLERNMENSTDCRLVWNGDGGFEVNHLSNQHTVDL